MVTLLFVSLPVAVTVSMANTFSPSATIRSISVRESGNSSKSLRPAYLKPSLPSTPLIMLHWIFVQSIRPYYILQMAATAIHQKQATCSNSLSNQPKLRVS
jgi:hypothetical protein